MANVQCQYDSPSDEDADRPRPQPSARPPDDHTYDLRDEPPAFIIQNSLQSQHLQITQSSSGTLEVAPKIMHHSFNVIQVGDRPYPQVSPQPEYNLNKRIRRSEVVLRQAADCVSRGSTFQTVSEQFNIPISTIRFFMARKGILPRRRRGRTTQTRVCNSPEPPFHMQHFKLPTMMALHDLDEEQN